MKEYFKNKRNSDDFHLLKNLKTLREPVDKHKYVYIQKFNKPPGMVISVIVTVHPDVF